MPKTATFTATEAILISQTMSQFSESGEGMNRTACRSFLGSIVNAINIAKGKAVSSLYCVSRKFLASLNKSTQWLKNGKITSDVFRGASGYSKSRAESGTDLRSSIMTGKFLESDADLFKRGILKTPNPLAHQVYNGDEVGFDPNGKWYKIYSLVSAAIRLFKICEGEKAPFW
jgi:hypothetical protein